MTDEALALLRGDAVVMERKLEDWRQRAESYRTQDTLEDAIALIRKLREALSEMSRSGQMK